MHYPNPYLNETICPVEKKPAINLIIILIRNHNNFGDKGIWFLGQNNSIIVTSDSYCGE